MKKLYQTRLILFGLAICLFGCSDDDQVDPAVRLQEDIEAIDQYLATNNIDAVEDPSGLRFVIHDVGLGKPLEETDVFFVTFEGRLIPDESLFDNVDEFFAISTAEIPLEGWRIGLPFISEGGSMTLYMPSGLAFGGFSRAAIPEQGLAALPENANVIYTVNIYDSEASIAQDALAIDQFLTQNGITAEVDAATDIRYVIREEGSGVRPTANSTVVIDYEGRFLGGDVFDSGVGAVFPLSNLIRGWQLGLPLIQEGGSITLYIPSFLAYGPTGRPPTIPGEAILVFDIDLEAVL